MKLNIIPVTAGFIYLLVQVYFCERRVVDLLYEQASLIAAIQIFILFRSGLNIRLYFCLDFSELKLAYKYSYRIFLQGFQDRILNQGVFLFLGPNMQSSLGHFVNASKTHQFGVKKGVLGISRVLFTSLAGADEDTKSSLLHRSFKNLSWVLPLVFICLNIAISILFSFLPVYWETAELYSHLLSLDLISYPFLIFIQNFLNSKGETRASFVLNTLRFLIVSISWPLVLWTNDFIYFIYGFLFSGIFALIIGLRYLPKSLFRFPLGTFILVLLIIFTYGQLLHSFSWI
jgi:hypothetical protein